MLEGTFSKDLDEERTKKFERKISWKKEKFFFEIFVPGLILFLENGLGSENT